MEIKPFNTFKNAICDRTIISLSTRAKEAIKTGLAMVIVFGIAFLFDWDKPEWGGNNR